METTQQTTRCSIAVQKCQGRDGRGRGDLALSDFCRWRPAQCPVHNPVPPGQGSRGLGLAVTEPCRSCEAKFRRLCSPKIPLGSPKGLCPPTLRNITYRNSPDTWGISACSKPLRLSRVAKVLESRKGLLHAPSNFTWFVVINYVPSEPPPLYVPGVSACTYQTRARRGSAEGSLDNNKAVAAYL